MIISTYEDLKELVGTDIEVKKVSITRGYSVDVSYYRKISHMDSRGGAVFFSQTNTCIRPQEKYQNFGINFVYITKEEEHLSVEQIKAIMKF